jgi:hypothetical protein
LILDKLKFSLNGGKGGTGGDGGDGAASLDGSRCLIPVFFILFLFLMIMI